MTIRFVGGRLLADSPAIHVDRTYEIVEATGAQFAIGCLGVGLVILAVVLRAGGLAGRLGIACVGVAVLVVATGRTPSGEDLVDLVPVGSADFSHELPRLAGNSKKTRMSCSSLSWRRMCPYEGHEPHSRK